VEPKSAFDKQYWQAIEHKMVDFSSLVSNTAGADKIIRTISYILRIIINRSEDKSNFVVRLSNILSPLSDTRFVLRFFGLIDNTNSFRSLTAKGNWWKDDSSMISMLQTLSMFFYYPCEHLYWLDTKKVIDLGDGVGAMLSKWSCRAWLFSVLLEIYIIGLEMMQKYNRLSKLNIILEKQKYQEASLGSMERISELNSHYLDEIKEIKSDLHKLLLRMIVSLGDLPLAWNWSLEESKLSPFLIGVFGTISSFAGLELKFIRN
jgi:hypothetical protein